MLRGGTRHTLSSGGSAALAACLRGRVVLRFGSSPLDTAELHRHFHMLSGGRWKSMALSTPLTTISTSTSSFDISRIVKLRMDVSNQSLSIGVVPSGRNHCTRLDGLSRPSCVRRVKKSSWWNSSSDLRMAIRSDTASMRRLSGESPCLRIQSQLSQVMALSWQ